MGKERLGKWARVLKVSSVMDFSPGYLLVLEAGLCITGMVEGGGKERSLDHLSFLFFLFFFSMLMLFQPPFPFLIPLFLSTPPHLSSFFLPPPSPSARRAPILDIYRCSWKYDGTVSVQLALADAFSVSQSAACMAHISERLLLSFILVPGGFFRPFFHPVPLSFLVLWGKKHPRK